MSSSVHTQVHLEVTDFYLSMYVVDSFLILLQPVWHDRHQVEMNLLRTVPRYIPSHTDWLVGHIDMNLLLRNVHIITHRLTSWTYIMYAAVKVGMSCRVTGITVWDPIWHASSHSSEAVRCNTLFTYLKPKVLSVLMMCKVWSDKEKELILFM